MPRANIKYELARDDPDTMDYYLQHAEDYQTTSKIQKSFFNIYGKSLILISIYFVLSVGLTFYQKRLFHSRGFNYPLGVATCHMLVKYFLSAFVRAMRKCKRGHQQVNLPWQSIVLALAPPGIASGFDVGFSSWAISLVVISFYTTVKSTTIIFILGFALIFKLEKKSWSLVGVVVMMSGGLIMFTYKSSQFHVFGFTLCLLASLSSGLRWTMAQLIIQKSKLGLNNPIDVIYYMQPWMLLAVIPIAVWFEGEKSYTDFQHVNWSESNHALLTTVAVFGGAILAFFMEISEFNVVIHTSSLTLSVIGVIKEITTLVLAYEFEGDQMNLLNFIGLLLCLGGIILHVTQKILTNKKQMVEHLELNTNSITTNGSSVDDGLETNVPLLTERSTSLTNLLNSNFSTDEEDNDRDKDDTSEVLFNILQRREQS
ncbi:hypothetical protein PV325_011493 [Microctonus aethiopoides]|uniref:Sugar phosphate transporter domain-containing protein n=1 Tax=Microctonus aethiopoides TaxID=144406 RepID=A0AA39KWG4_9HYME|nr:hypothetical protein PV325_011493 [Microctonus aethiopoides]KAK0097691.1 hypothetical protein PV326_000080 [Microctonus aethiopoides]KAK0176320.1 hypothetical protein PV328_000467 [Microctonus aethiopoides]